MKASHYIQPWQPMKLIQWEQNSKHCNYLTQGIDPLSMYANMCSGFNHNFGSLGGKSYQNAWQTLFWSTHHLMWLPAQCDLIVYENFLKLLVQHSPRNESGKVVNQLSKVGTWCRNSYTNNRKFARSGMLWHSLMFQLMELLYSFQDIDKWNAVVVSYNSNYSTQWLMIFWLLLPREFRMIVRLV